MKKLSGLLLLALILAPIVRAEEILVRKNGKLVTATVPDVKDSDFIFAGTPTLVRSTPLGQRRVSQSVQSVPPAPLADPNAFYSNVDQFLSTAWLNGGAALQVPNTITRLVADDLTATALPLHPGDPITSIVFSVANSNGVAVNAQPRVRFYQDNAGVPGTLINGFSFGAILFPLSSVHLYTFNPGGGVPFAAGSKIWAGMTFDDAGGTSGATLAQLNLLGQGVYGPPAVGTSADLVFVTTAAGSFFGSNPAGATTNFAGGPLANLGWEFATPVELQSFNAE
jgi:hypothetical protein